MYFHQCILKILRVLNRFQLTSYFIQTFKSKLQREKRNIWKLRNDPMTINKVECMGTKEKIPIKITQNLQTTL